MESIDLNNDSTLVFDSFDVDIVVKVMSHTIFSRWIRGTTNLLPLTVYLANIAQARHFCFWFLFSLEPKVNRGRHLRCSLRRFGWPLRRLFVSVTICSVLTG